MISRRHVYLMLGLVIIWSVVPAWATTIPYCAMCIFIALKFWKISQAIFPLAAIAGAIAYMCPSLYGATVENVKIYQRTVWALHILQITSLISLGIVVIILISFANGTKRSTQDGVSNFVTIPDSLIELTNFTVRESIIQNITPCTDSDNLEILSKSYIYVNIEDNYMWAAQSDARENVIQSVNHALEIDIDETDNK